MESLEQTAIRQRRSAPISIVVPVYRSTTSLSILVDRVAQAFGERFEYEVIMIDDGSPPTSWAAISAICAANPRVVGVRLSRNYGQQAALLAGIRIANGAVVVTMDDDLQNQPEEAIKLVDRLLNDHLDVVYGISPKRHQSNWRRWGGSALRSTVLKSLDVADSENLSQFRAFRTELRNAFPENLGDGISLDALLAWTTESRDSISVNEAPRMYGTSTYNFRKLVSHAVDVATGYSVRPLQIASFLGVVSGFLSAVVLLVIVCQWLINGSSVPGFAFLACTISFFASAQLLVIGVVGEYLARMHFRIMGRPSYVIRETTLTTRPSPLSDGQEST